MSRPAQLRARQIGYAVSPTGESLVGTKDGDWLSAWVVVGYQELCGDPFFIDRFKSGFPVYSAMHGGGRSEARKNRCFIGGNLAMASRPWAAVAQGRDTPCRPSRQSAATV